MATLIPESSLIFISDGSTVSVTCRGSGILTWTSTSGPVIPLVTGLTTSETVYQRRDSTSNTQQLVIENFGTSNQNEYTCSTNTGNGQITESILLAGCKLTFDIENISIYAVLFAALAIYISSPIIYTSLGADTNITAAFVGSDNAPVITWMFNGQQIDPNTNSHYTTVTTSTSQTLIIHCVNNDVLGTYTVTISNGGSTQSDAVQIAFPGTYVYLLPCHLLHSLKLLTISQLQQLTIS